VGAKVLERPLTPELSVVDVLEDLLWHKDGRVSLVYRLEALHEPGLSDDDFDRHALLAENVFSSGVPDRTTWQFFVLVDHRDGVRQLAEALPEIQDPSATGRLFEELRQAKIAELSRSHVTGGQLSLLQSRRHYLVVSFGPSAFRIPLWQDWLIRLRRLWGETAPYAGFGKYGEAFARVLEETKQVDRAATMGLLQIGLGFKRCVSREIVSFLWELMNPTSSRLLDVDTLSQRARVERDGLPSVIVEELPWAGDTSPVWSLLGDDMLVRRSHLELGDRFVTVVSLRELPDRTEPGALVGLLHLCRERYVLSYRVDVPNAASEIAALRAKATLAAGLRLQDFIVESKRTDAVADAVQKQSDEAIERMISSTQRIFGVTLQLVLYETSRTDLEEAVQEVLGVMSRAHGLRGVREGFLLKRAYLSFLPGAPPLVERRRKALTPNMVDLLPIYDFRVGQGKVPFLTPKNSLVLYDPWARHLPNSNIMITGTSGSGKSFLASTILASYEIGCRGVGEPPPYVFVLDNGASYQRFMEIRAGEDGRGDGRYISFSLDQPVGVDVFGWTLEDGSLDEHVSRLEWLLLDLLRVSPVDEERFERMKACVEAALYQVYRENMRRDFSGFAQALKRVPQAEELLPGLFPFTDGKFARLLLPNPDLALHEDVRAVCYDFKDLSEHRDLASVALRLVIYQVWRWASRVARRLHRTFLLIDESWALMEGGSGGSLASQGAPFLSACARMGRKNGMSLLSLSQSIFDWANSAYGLAIIGNSSTKFVGVSEAAEIEELKKQLKLTARQVDAVRRLARTDRFHEFLLVQGESSHVVRVPGDPLSRWVFTTSPRDRDRLAALSLSHPEVSLLERIRLLAAEGS